MKKPKPIFRTNDHQDLWRPYPAFIGPLMPPMLLWFARGRPKSAWEVAVEDRHAAARAPADLFGTAWLNLGDSYANDGKWGGHSGGKHVKRYTGFKPKDLMGVPWTVAFALRARGWWIRSEIIWHKPNPMPESVTDRPTSAHEKVFLLTKSDRYFYDADAIAEDSCVGDTRPQTRRARELANQGGLTDAHISALKSCGVGDAGKAQTTQSGFGKNKPEIQTLADEAKSVLGGYSREFLIAEKRNARNVWTIATQPFKGSHFATMPPDLAERCIKAGCPRGGHVLDPFGGAGTTGLVADRLGRHATLIELNPAYRDMAAERVRADAPLFSQAAE